VGFGPDVAQAGDDLERPPSGFATARSKELVVDMVKDCIAEAEAAGFTIFSATPGQGLQHWFAGNAKVGELFHRISLDLALCFTRELCQIALPPLGGVAAICHRPLGV
jgi:hypothetical protein